ncbi:MAG: hypothetical protein ACYTGC_01825 [Planctomycetota bacterium]|jgi:hypothetical protein
MRPHWLVAPLLLSVGCATTEGPQQLTVPAGRYEEAFAAAIDVAADERMDATFRDIRGGVIETAPARAASWLEPWYWGGQSAARIAENSIGHERRRARFEFAPVDDAEDAVPQSPDLLAAGAKPVDLLVLDAEMTLRVWVFLEREQRPGTRRSTWTRTRTTHTIIVSPEDGSDESKPFWVPVARDLDFERRMLAALEDRLQQDPPGEVRPDEPADAATPP